MLVCIHGIHVHRYKRESITMSSSSSSSPATTTSTTITSSATTTSSTAIVEQPGEDTCVVYNTETNNAQVISSLAMTQLELFAQTFRQHIHTELEVIIIDTTIPSGVKFAIIEELHSALAEGSKAGAFVELEKTFYLDFFYPKSVRARYTNGKNKPTYIRKLSLGRVEMLCPQRTGVMIRANLKDEQPVRMSPIDGVPLFCRLQECWRFVYQNKFEYVLKKVVSGKDKETACRNIPTFEIEIELLRNKTYLAKTNDVVIIRSLVSKAVDILGRYCKKTGVQDLLELELLASDTPNLTDSKKIARQQKTNSSKKSRVVADHPSCNKKPKTTATSIDPSGVSNTFMQQQAV